MDWLDEEIGTWKTGRRCLVLCQNRATLALVRRWAARKGGLLGLEAVTPAGLAGQVRQDPILAGPRTRREPEEGLPAHTEIGRRIGDRPGLAGAARIWVQHLRALERVSAPHRAPRWLQELAATGYGRDEEEDAIYAFLDAVQARGRELSSSASWDRVVALGFARPAAALEPWAPWLVRTLTGRGAPEPAPGSAAPLDAWVVPDVASEARLAVRIARQDPDGTLILAAQAATARRVRDALARNGLGCTFKDSEALAVHELASAVRRCAPWFVHPPDPPIPLADLAFVLSRTALGRNLHPAAEQAVAQLAGPAPGRPTRGTLTEALESTRLLDGPLSLWRARIGERLEEARGEPEAAEKVAVLAGVAVRLALLAAALESRPVEDVLGELVGARVEFDADDFESVVATLLGEAPTADLPSGHKLGAIQRFLLACRVRVHDDSVARAIVGALRSRSEWPVSPSHVHHALSGAVDLGMLSEGVDLVMVEDYDDRPCRQLVLLDVHDHGVASGATPDPLLDDDELAALGVLAGRHVVEERLRLVRRAAERAGRTIAIVAERDANGREVVAPIQLDLRPVAGADDVDSYGIGLPGLPESAAPPIALRLAEDGEVAAPPTGDDAAAWLAVQATAEWFREGRAAGQGPSAAEQGTLAEIRRAEAPPPAFVRSYLGYAEPALQAALGSERDTPQPYSVSRLLLPLAHCGYQAFATNVLGIRKRDPIADDLDPRELGTVVHRAIERVGSTLRRAESEEERAALVARLRASTNDAFAEAITKLGSLSAARKTAVDGQRDRWNVHWHKYVLSRAKRPASQGFPKAIEDHPELHRWAAQLAEQVPALASVPAEKLRYWVLYTARDTPASAVNQPMPMFLREGEREALPPSAGPDLAAIVRSPEWADLHRTVQEAVDRLEIWAQAPFASGAEVPFGPGEPEPGALGGPQIPPGSTLSLGPIALRLGVHELQVQGRIDRLDFIGEPAPGRPRFVGVTDYKTGVQRTGWQFRKDQRNLRDPQLLVYAMVAERASANGQLPDGLQGARTVVVAQDRLKQVVDDADASSADDAKAVDTWMAVDRKWLGWAARELGTLVDDARAGRWPLRPRADTCPKLAQFGSDGCPLASACRLRGLPPREGAR